MKPIKFVTAGLGLLFLVAVFLPFVSAGGISLSLWSVRELKAGPTYVILVASVVVLGLSALAIGGRLGRVVAGGITLASLVVAFIALFQFNGHHGMGSNISLLMDQGAYGAKILVFGGTLALIAGIAGLVKPEPKT
jgi:hypothetical protein